MKYPKDKKQLDDFYTEWHEVNKEELKDTWTRAEVYNFASSYAARSFSKFYRRNKKRVLPLGDENQNDSFKRVLLKDFAEKYNQFYNVEEINEAVIDEFLKGNL